MALLTPSEVEARLAAVPRWSRHGDAIARTFPFPDFATAMTFVNRVADLAEQAWHHPDIDIRWRKVTLSITTHDEGGLTERDFSLAAAIDELQPRSEESA